MIHLIPLFEGGLIFLTLEVFLFKPASWIYAMAAITALIFLGALIPKRKYSSRRDFFHFIFNPLIFAWSAFLLLLFFENIYFRHFFVLGVAAYLFFYFENLFYYLIGEKEKNADNFLRMTNLMNVVSIFFLAAGLYGVKTFIQLPIWPLAAVFFVFSGALVYGVLGIVKPAFREIIFDIIVLSLIIMEFFVVLSFLPIGFYAGGAILGIIYYMIAGIVISFLKNAAAPYKRYVIVGGILLAIVILTARWM